MPEYLAPGVFVEETSFRNRSIEGVGTSVAGIVGPTPTGPVRGRPELCTSYADFERRYGGPGDITFGSGSSAVTRLNNTALAARAFFDNGGRQLYVARVFSGSNNTDAAGSGGTAQTASVAANGGLVRFSARFPGAGGNLDLRLSWGDSQSLLRTRSMDALPDGETALVAITGTIEAGDVDDTGTHSGFPLTSLTALVTNVAGVLTFVAGTNARVVNTGETAVSTVPVAELGSGIALTAIAGDTVVFTQGSAAVPASGPLVGETPAELVLSRASNISDFVPGGEHWANNRILRGWITDDGFSFFVTNNPVNAGVSATTTIGDTERAGYLVSLSALAGDPGAARSLKVQRSVAIDVLRDGETVYSFPVAQLSGDPETGLPGILPASPERRLDQQTQPISASVAAGSSQAQIHDTLMKMMRITNGSAFSPTDGFGEPQYLISLSGGTDGDAPEATDYAGESNELTGSTGFAALEEVEEISIVMVPDAAADSAQHQAITVQMETHVNRMRYRIGVVDPQEGWALSEVRAFRDNFNNTRLALYYPWIVVSDPTGDRDSISVPPSGSIAGVMARTDFQRGVHKAPANTPVTGALRFAQEINTFQQEILNPAGVNVLRSFPGRGHLVWGARTMSPDPEWKYVNVRRYFLSLERALERGMPWAVFEPNGEALWANVTATIDDFLFNEFVSGRLLGSTPREAYFVRCDRSTMTQNDIDNGRLIALVGVAPLRPAEFVVIRIGQKTADAS